MQTILLPDGYNGHVVECEIDPIEKDGEVYKLRVKGSSHLTKWCSRQQWEAYTKEIEVGLINEVQKGEQNANTSL